MKTEAWMVSEVEMGLVWKENDGEHRFKPCKVEAEWLKESRRGDVWTKVMVLRLTAWEGGSDVINRKAAKHPGEGDEGDELLQWVAVL